MNDRDKEENTREPSKSVKVSFGGLVNLFEQTQEAMQMQAARSVDIALVVRNWLFGWYIVEFENGGADRAELYGKNLLKNLSKSLENKGLKGVSVTNLKLCRSFYIIYRQIGQTLSDQSRLDFFNIGQTLSVESFSSSFSKTISRELVKDGTSSFEIWQTLSTKFSLSWSHYVVLLTVKSEDERHFYELEAIDNAWGIRELKRQINSSLYEKLALNSYKTNERLNNLETKQIETDNKINHLFDAIDEKGITKQGIFYDGQIFDAYVFVADLIKSANKSIVLVDNYIDESVLQLFTKRKSNVHVTIFTKRITKILEQVKRNINRFPKNFMFQLNNSEVNLMVSQNAIPCRGVLLFACSEGAFCSSLG